MKEKNETTQASPTVAATASVLLAASSVPDKLSGSGRTPPAIPTNGAQQGDYSGKAAKTQRDTQSSKASSATDGPLLPSIEKGGPIENIFRRQQANRRRMRFSRCVNTFSAICKASARNLAGSQTS